MSIDLNNLKMSILNKIRTFLYNFFIRSRQYNEDFQKDLDLCLWNDKSLSEKDYDAIKDVIHNGAYYILHDNKVKEHLPYAITYSKLCRKYVPKLKSEYPTNINIIYKNFKKDILSYI